MISPSSTTRWRRSLACPCRATAAPGSTTTLPNGGRPSRTRTHEGFIRDYARFAKLPSPRLEPIGWAHFLAQLRSQVAFEFDERTYGGDGGDGSARVDTAQLEQGLLNLLKNAHESGSPEHEVKLGLRRAPDAWRIDGPTAAPA